MQATLWTYGIVFWDLSAKRFCALLNELVIVTNFVWDSCLRFQPCSHIIFLIPKVNAVLTSLSWNLTTHFFLLYRKILMLMWLVSHVAYVLQTGNLIFPSESSLSYLW